ncbi:hypothetical protein GCM10009678_49590 [Actinomadura kijaniata]|uniref:Uncharacterized protein n=1 Tax=Actinomadura namibiensis TaxID=182080 RepID=A0A7W3LNV8_ACTNM|nr:hypothetical protein [Actinomadura namibiensis]MBA8951563.1 hypothetical protein [Actinomadura namibiensis]
MGHAAPATTAGNRSGRDANTEDAEDVEGEGDGGGPSQAAAIDASRTRAAARPGSFTTAPSLRAGPAGRLRRYPIVTSG